jgi:hypothetical protein
VRFAYGYEPGQINGAAVSFYEWGVANGEWHPATSGYVAAPGTWRSMAALSLQWGSILLCLSPYASLLDAARAVAGRPRGVCSAARCGMCLGLRLVR